MYIHVITCHLACSSNDDTAFMLDCIHAGAVDYLLKPLHMDVIKTMFLVCVLYMSLFSFPLPQHYSCH